MDKYLEKKWFLALYLLLWTFVCVTIASECSFLFRMNEWSDANCYMSVAKMMHKGKVLYRDIFEQKGPYLYFVHYFAIAISSTTFYGMYLFEILFGYIVAIFAYKSLKLYIESPHRRYIFVTLFLTFYYMSPAFAQGDSAEEMAMPLMAIAMYFMLKSIKNERHMPFYEMILLGFFCGVSLLIKFTIIGYFCACAFVVFLFDMMDKKIGRGFLQIPYFFLGVGIAFIPCILYFRANHAFDSFFKVYFYDNIFVYGKTANITPTKTNPWWLKIGCSLLGYIISFGVLYPIYISLFFAFFYAKKHHLFKTRLGLYMCITYAITAVVSYAGGKIFVYYGLPFTVFGIVGMLAINQYSYSWKKIPEFISKVKWKFAPIYLGVLFLAIFLINEDCWAIFRPKSSYYQYDMAEIIDEYRTTHEEEPTLLNYGYLDGGVYMTSGITPTCKYFCTVNMHLDEMFQEQKDVLEQGKVTFVCTKNIKLDETYDQYVLVYHKNTVYEFLHYDFYLYQLKSTL